MNKLESKSEIKATPAKRTAKKTPDGGAEIVLGNGTAVTFRPVDAGDFVTADEDENMMIAALVTKWGDRDSVMGVELSSRGFLDIADAVFLKKILRKLYTPDLDTLSKKTSVEDLGEEGVKAKLPSGLRIHLRRPDGYDLERNDLTQIDGGGNPLQQGMELAKASLKLAAMLAIRWGDLKGGIDTPAITYEQMLERGMLPADDVYALIKVVSDCFFRVEDSIDF